jgi:hypothetical protein
MAPDGQTRCGSSGGGSGSCSRGDLGKSLPEGQSFDTVLAPVQKKKK